MQLKTWVSSDVHSEIKLSDSEEYAAQKILEVLQAYTIDCRGFMSFSVTKTSTMGANPPGWAGEHFEIKAEPWIGEDTVKLTCGVWVGKKGDSFKLISILWIKSEDEGFLQLEFGENESVRRIIYLNQEVYVEGMTQKHEPGLPKLGKFFVLDHRSVN